jgi:hypothetical protein
MMTLALLTSIGLCTALLSGASLMSNLAGTAAAGLVVGSTWLMAEAFAWRSVSSPCMATLTFLSAVSAVFDAPPLPLISAAVLALAAWDLSRFRKRLAGAAPEKARRDMERKHLLRLFSVSLIGLATAVLATGIRLRGDFFAEIVMAGLAFFLLYRFVDRISRWGDSPDPLSGRRRASSAKRADGPGSIYKY